MPTQPSLPLNFERLLKNRAAQLKAIQEELLARIAADRFVAKDGYPVRKAMLRSVMLHFDSVCSDTGAANDRPWNWETQASRARVIGCSVQTLERALSVLKSLGLLEIKDEWIGTNKRRLHVRIRWETVFSLHPIEQDPEDVALWTRNQTRQRNLFGRQLFPQSEASYSHNLVGAIPTTCGNAIPTMLGNAPIYDPLTSSAHPSAAGGWEGGEESFQSSVISRQSEVFDAIGQSATGRISAGTSAHGDESTGDDVRLLRLGPAADHQQRIGREDRRMGTRQRVPNGSLPDVGRDESGQGTVLGRQRDGSAVSPEAERVQEPDAVLPAPVEADGHRPRTTSAAAGVKEDSLAEAQRRGELSGSAALRETKNQEPTIKDLVRRLFDLGIDSPAAVLKASQRAGYSLPQIAVIVDWYASQGRQDAKGKVWYPYTPAQLAMRLRDEVALENNATPARGSWKGGKCGIWASLGADGSGQSAVGSRGRGGDGGMVVPSAEAIEKQQRLEALTPREGLQLLELAASGPESLELTHRARKALPWAKTNWTESRNFGQVPKELRKLVWELLRAVGNGQSAMGATP